MGNQITSELLFETLSGVLEEAAFIFTESADETLQWSDPLVESSISFEGQENGVVALAVEKQMASNFAANLLGIDPNDEDAKFRSAEALSEMLNIVCGVFLERWLGKSNHCRLGLPSTKALSAEQQIKNIKEARCSAILEDEEGNRIDIYVR